MKYSLITTLTCAVAFLTLVFDHSNAQTPADFKLWGEQCLDQIQKDYYISDRRLYADEWKRIGQNNRNPAFMWGCGVMLPALVAGATLDRKKYLQPMRSYIDALEVYWTPGDNNIPGYDVLPNPNPADIYFDDNMWIDIALVDAYELTHNVVYLDKARKVFRLIASGEDEKLGGGIYWRQRERTSKNTCSNAPAIVAALRLYQATHEPTYLADAKRLYAWTNTHLQDTDGLYWDNIKLDGKTEKTKWSYNTALMLRANVMLHEITRDVRYRTESERIARVAEARWIKSDTSAIGDGAQFAHLLSEAFLYLYEDDRDSHWHELVTKALNFVHGNLRDSDGRYSDHWDTPVKGLVDKAGILSQASVARAYFVSAIIQ